MKNEKTTKEIAAEIRIAIKEIKGVKLSVISDYNHISVSIMAAPFEIFTSEAPKKDNRPVNQYNYMENNELTSEAKTIFAKVDEIIKKYHWDESDSMTDYFNCAFYYSYAVGKWDKPVKIEALKAESPKQEPATDIKINDQVLFGKGEALIVGNIVEVREKAVKMDYAVEPVMVSNNVIVFNYTTWIPKSVMILDRGSISVKKWFAEKFEGGRNIKKYFIEGGKQIFI